ncbi:methyltransferase-like protein 25B [Dendroctonus ponderosae]|uniref:Methyltransferase domain-containing protein n=1 Tax=Dendroctonus ponderosae TaxID=77166 RepID=U4UKN0_DENPD|nr:methyltransferase-like protein 25B [Dendroctonus ponderosae]ERL94634.1 hypothetical protein D910_11909 [Dendroctonus ponderosae]
MSGSNVKEAINVCNNVVGLYRDLLNSYVSDFYIENHWNLKVSNSWKNFLEELTFVQVSELLNYDSQSLTYVAPLTLLCLQTILRKFSIQRKQVNVPEVFKIDDQLMKLLWKNVKLKKRHEIELMSRICYQAALKTNCFNIVDVGSGLGHLSRLLAFKYGFNVCTFEANSVLVNLALELDNKIAKSLISKHIKYINVVKPLHSSRRIEETLSSEDFLFAVKKAFANNQNNFQFGIVGLHPCGNLGSTLLRLYSESSGAKFINIVSCCYMKLSLDPASHCGFPLSAFCKQTDYQLDYLSCETACHAIENYVDKIKITGYQHLKIHSFRAALECLLAKNNLRHSAVGNVKYETGLSFREYCRKATKKYDLTFCPSDLEMYENLVDATWVQVVKFYSLRLLLAPLVESIILYDRLFYLKETQSHCDIMPVFDSHISPRNHVLSARKIARPIHK